jgi:hypothetical protein
MLHVVSELNLALNAAELNRLFHGDRGQGGSRSRWRHVTARIEDSIVPGPERQRFGRKRRTYDGGEVFHSHRCPALEGSLRGPANSLQDKFKMIYTNILHSLLQCKVGQMCRF